MKSTPGGLADVYVSKGRVGGGSPADDRDNHSNHSSHCAVEDLQVSVEHQESLEDENRRLKFELDEMTRELVTSRVMIANLNMDLDSEKLKYMQLRGQMREFSARVAALEVQAAEKEDRQSQWLCCFRPRPDPRRKFGRMMTTDPELLEDQDDDMFSPVLKQPSQQRALEMNAVDTSSHSVRSISHNDKGEKMSRTPVKRVVNSNPSKKKIDTSGAPKPSWLN
jgi:hypothetical protein